MKTEQTENKTDISLLNNMLEAFQMTDLNEIDKAKLKAFDKDILDLVANNVMFALSKKMLQEEINREYVLWAKFALYSFIKHFRTDWKN